MRTSRRQLASLCSALLLWQALAAPRGRADEPAPPVSPAEPPTSETLPEAYTRAVNVGFEEYELRHYQEARARFREAHAMFPNARSLRALGAVEYDLQNYVAAVAYLEAALASAVRPLHATLRADTEALLARARAYTGSYPVLLVPPDAELAVDGQPAERDVRGAIQLSIGPHALSAKAPGFAELQRRLTVEPGAHDAITLELTPLPAPVRATAEGSTRSRWWLWTLAAALAGGAAAGIAVAARAGDARSEPSASNLPGVRSVSAGVSGP